MYAFFSFILDRIEYRSLDISCLVKFGIPLADQLDEGREIPLFVLKITSFLEANGIYFLNYNCDD